MAVAGIDSLRTAATMLGLRLEAPDLPWWKNHDLAILEGVVDGTHVVVQQGADGSVSPVLRVYFHASLDPQLDMGLEIRLRQSFAGRPPLGANDLLGTPAFEEAFLYRSVEPPRLQALFGRDVQTALVEWHNARIWERDDARNLLDFWITDESVILRIEIDALGFGFTTKPIPLEELVADVRATVALARAVEAAARNVPPSTIVAPFAPGWRAFADTHALAFSESPLRVSGAFSGVRFTARAAHVERGRFATELTMSFARPLPLYVRIGPQSGWFKAPSGYPDQWAEWARPRKTGDDAFDDVLRVVSADAAKQNALLDADVRRALVALTQSHDHVHLTTDAITVRTGAMIPAEGFAPILAALADVEKTIDRAVSR